MLIETTHSSTVVARGEVRALQLTRDELRAQMLEDPSIAETLVHNIAMRLIRMAEELRQVDAALAGDRRRLPARRAAAASAAGRRCFPLRSTRPLA